MTPQNTELVVPVVWVAALVYQSTTTFCGISIFAVDHSTNGTVAIEIEEFAGFPSTCAPNGSHPLTSIR